MKRKLQKKFNKPIESNNEEHSDDVEEDIEKIIESESEKSQTEELLDENSDQVKKSSIKKKKRGIIYLSTLPKYMTVTIARELFGQYADVGRIYFEPAKKHGEDADDKKSKKKRKKQSRHFSEGWIEFNSKRAAKQIAEKLNNSPIATRKSSKFYDILWSIKYLPRFKWIHLSERLSYEKAVFKQRMRAELSQARKEAEFFQENLDKSDKNKRLKKKAKLNT